MNHIYTISLFPPLPTSIPPPPPPPTFSPSLTSLMISVDVKHPVYLLKRYTELRSCVNREAGLGSRSLSYAFPVPVKPFGLCGRKAHERRKAVRVTMGGRNLRTSCSHSLSDVRTMTTSPQPSDCFESSGSAVFRPCADSTGTYLRHCMK